MSVERAYGFECKNPKCKMENQPPAKRRELVRKLRAAVRSARIAPAGKP